MAEKIKQPKAPADTWNEKLKERRQEHADSYARAMLVPPTPTTFNNILPNPGVILLMGERRMGKSGTAHAVAQDAHDRLHMPRVLHLPSHIKKTVTEKIRKLLPPDFIITTKVSEWPTGAVIIFDEAAQGAHARRTSSGDSVELDNIVGISGQRKQIVVFISHHSRKLDINLVTEVNQIWFKCPSYAHTIFERDEVSDFTMRAWDYFDGLRRHKAWRELAPEQQVLIKSSTLALDMDQFHFYCFRNRLPDYWTQELSCLFDEIEAIKPKTASSSRFGKPQNANSFDE